MSSNHTVFWLTALFAIFLIAAGSAEAQSKAKMKYLVIGDYIDPGPLLPPAQAGQMLENVVLPSMDMLSKWEADHKILGGICVGERRGVFVVEAESNEEVDKMLESLPFWGLLKWNVTALNSFASRAAQDKMSMAAMKSMGK